MCVVTLARRPGDRAAGYRRALAPHGLPAFLDLEVSTSPRTHANRPRCARSRPAHDYRQLHLGRPRIHGELLKLGIDIGERTVSRLMPREPRKPPSQTWRTFLDNHLGTLASIDFFTVPTATFRVLFVFLVLVHNRRRVLHFNVTEHPSAA